MSNPLFKNGAMKQRKRIILEPDLEALAGHLSGEDRLKLAREMRGWLRELECTGYILIAARNRSPWKRARLPRFPRHSEVLN